MEFDFAADRIINTEINLPGIILKKYLKKYHNRVILNVI